jgi:hypothetical protein
MIFPLTLWWKEISKYIGRKLSNILFNLNLILL